MDMIFYSYSFDKDCSLTGVVFKFLSCEMWSAILQCSLYALNMLASFWMECLSLSRIRYI